MAKTSTSFNERAQTSVESASNITPVETGAGIQSDDILAGIGEAPARNELPQQETVSEVETQSSTQASQQSQQRQQQEPVKSQSFQQIRYDGISPTTPSQPSQQMPTRPMSVAADIASSFGLQEGQQSVPYSPLATLITPRQSRERVAASDEVRDIKHEAAVNEAMQLANQMQGPLQSASMQGERQRPQQQLQTQSISDEGAKAPTRPASESPTASMAVNRLEQDNNEKISAISSFGVTEARKPANPVGFINKIFSGAQSRISDKAHDAIKRLIPVGNAFNAKMLGDATIPPHGVSIGSENLLTAIREPGSNIIELVNSKTGDNLTLDECVADISLLVDAINRADIEVVLQKSPDNRRDSIQVRSLFAHIGVNMRIHPTQLKAYNADFDGDDGKLMLDQRLLDKYERAMSVLIGIDGKANIDSDFFPLDPVDDSRKKVLDLMIEKDFAWNELIARAIVQEYIDVANNPTNANWVKLLRKIDDTCNRMTTDAKRRQKLVSRTFGSLYEFARRRRMLNVQAISEDRNYSEQFSNFDPPPAGVDPFVVMMIDIQDEVIAGRPAPNMQEFAKMYSRFTGEPLDSDGMPTNKNVPFRLVADFGKAIKRSEFILIGESTPIRVDDNIEYITFDQLYQITCSAAVTKQIAGRMHMGSHELRASTQLRSIMMREVGLPKPGEPFNDFIKRFRSEYNYHSRLLEVSKTIRFRADMRISRSFGWDGITEMKKIGKALIDIYGDRTVEDMFPNITKLAYDIPESELRTRKTSKGVLSKYHGMSLSQFAINNKLDVNMVEIENRFKNGTWGEMDILLLVADRRRASTQAYRDNWESWTKEFSDIIPNIQKSIVKKDYNRYSRDMLDLMHMASPDMFAYYQMDDFTSFVNSDYGQKLLLSKDVDSFRSTWVTMLIEYRMDKAMRIYAEKADAANLAVDTVDRQKVIDALDAAYDAELDTLASSSYAWKAIIEEARSGNQNFRMLIEAGKSKYTANGSEWNLNGAKFWTSGEARKYGSLYAFLKSDASYVDKMNVLSDITRIRENFKGIMSFEMIGQLAHHPHRVHDGSQFDESGSLDTKPFKTSMDRLSSMMTRSPKQARKFANDLVKQAKNDKPGFERFVQKLASDKGFLVHMDIELAADVMASVADKDYSDTEKIKQQQRVNGYFQSASMLRNGGLYTHVQQTDNRVLNVIGYDQLTAIDLIRIIGTPNQTYYGYDEFGRLAPISRSTICGGNIIDDVIDYIEANPQVAYIFRRYSANINDDTGKGVKISGTCSLRGVNNSFALYSDNGDQRSVELKAYHEMIDRPEFFELVALMTPVGLDTGRTLSGKYAKAIESMCNLLSYLAKFDKKVSPEKMEEMFFDHTGISKEKIMQATRKAKFDDGSGYDETQASILYARVIGEMCDCVSLLASKGIISDQVSESFKWDIDNNSVISAPDVRQQFNGSRTATMIGVEGSETNRNQIFKLYLNHRPERFFIVGDNSSEDEVRELSRITGRDLETEIAYNGFAVIDRNENEGLKDWVASDPTLERNKDKQLSSGARYFEIKRDSAAEEFNAKSKKFGDDGTNSVTKFDKFDYGKANDLRIDLMASSRDDAIYMLANALMQADIDLGYKQFPISDYLNRADVMLAEDGDSFVIRTFEQLSTACRNRLSSEARYGGDFNRTVAEIEQIVSTLGTSLDTVQAEEAEIVHDLVYGVYRFGSGQSFKSDRAILERASSIERNYDMLMRFYKEFQDTYMPDGKRFIPPSRKAVEDLSSKAFSELKKSNPKAAEKIRGLAFPYMRYDKNIKDKVENPHGDHKSIYDYLGRADDENLVLLPGPTNVVLFDSQNQDVLDQCMKYGITAIFDGIENIPDDLQADAQELGDDVYIVPFFYMALNGATGTQLGPSPAVYQYHPTNYTVCVEETTGEIRAGDATAHITKELGDRTQVVWGDDVSFSAEELFPNVMETFSGDNFDYRVDFCSREEVQKYIINQFDDATIDIGIMPNEDGFDREMQKMETRIAEYASRFDEANSVSFLTGPMEKDHIIGFVKIIVNGQIKAFAPVIPFNSRKSGTAPRHYTVASLGYDNATRSFQMAWRYEGDIRGQSVKFFEGIGASNKMMTNGDYIRSRTLANGLPVDVMYSTKSVASRLFASNKRINTLISLMMIPRVDLRYAYNFADLDGAFPNNPELREMLRTGTMTKQMWFDMIDANQRFHADDEIDSVVRFMVNRCKEYGTVNPSVILANKFYDEEGDSQIKLLITEFEAFMDTSINFQNGLMKLMNSLQPSLCPPNIEGNSDGTLFKPNLGFGDQYGVLQMLVPHYMSESDSEPFYALENVYISPGFFGDVFSGFERYTVDTGLANEDLVVANGMSDEMLMQYAAIGASEYAPLDKMLMRGMSITPDSFIIDSSN